uniref:Hdr-like menaquinol-oxidizing enzyme, subunit E n=1 Tax=uncultured sulfate-reducing bacterium TaxID=153939 RepID=Q3IBJ8_9BACT|nr:Hdr-like menaquinol-oxidizing enzyme, subunit E [uncultured sulfate-reducing bacterium]
MHDAGKVIAGLVVFLALVTSPMWYQVARGAETKPPELALVADAKDCVAPAEYMRALHMDLLDVWRDEAVRDGDRIYVGFDGREHEKSLTGTCLSCHSSKEAFCNRCHEYVGADPYCWDCHIDPGEGH